MKQLHKEVINLIKSEEQHILDAGCGEGEVVSALKEKGYKVIGVDIKGEGCDYQLDLNEKTNFKSNCFDIVVAIEVIEHLENPRHFLREIKRILKDKGMAIITTPNVCSLKARLYYLIKGYLFGFREEDYKVSGHITPILINDFKRICNELNFGLDIKNHKDTFIFILGEIK